MWSESVPSSHHLKFLKVWVPFSDDRLLLLCMCANLLFACCVRSRVDGRTWLGKCSSDWFIRLKATPIFLFKSRTWRRTWRQMIFVWWCQCQNSKMIGTFWLALTCNPSATCFHACRFDYLELPLLFTQSQCANVTFPMRKFRLKRGGNRTLRMYSS